MPSAGKAQNLLMFNLLLLGFNWIMNDCRRTIQTHYGPAVDSASNRNEYQEYFLGVMAAGA